MSKNNQQQGGFTLVEISLAMAIFTFMLLVVSLAYINIARLYNASTAARNVQQNNRFAMEQMSRVARSSSAARVIDDGTIRGVCLDSSTGSQLFYLKRLNPSNPQQNELRQASSCDAPSDVNSKPLSSPDAYAAKLEATTETSTVTLSLWMASRVDLLDNADSSGLRCKGGVGSEFCAINKLTTTVELRGK